MRRLFSGGVGQDSHFQVVACGREQVLAVEGPGSSFAEVPVFDGKIGANH